MQRLKRNEIKWNLTSNCCERFSRKVKRAGKKGREREGFGREGGREEDVLEREKDGER